MGSKEYPLSMTGSAARRPDCVTAAVLYLELGDWDAVKQRIMEDNPFQLNTDSARKRISQEVVKRLRTLTDSEVRFLAGSHGDDQAAMVWVSICRTYPFMRALSREAIAGRFEGMAAELTVGAYEALFEKESLDHPELEKLAESSKKKMRSQIFRMAQECMLIDKAGVITPIFPSASFNKILQDGGRAEDLLLFPKVV